MKIPRPREIVGSQARGPSLLWIVGLLVMFAPPVATIAWFYRIALVGSGTAADAEALGVVTIANWVALIAFYIAVLSEAPRFGRAHGHRYRLIHANPKLLFALWLVHVAVSWVALGLQRGSIGTDAQVDPLWVERGGGAFLIALALVIVAWALARYRSPR